MKNLLVLLFFVPLFTIAQKSHTVQAKETLYSLARKYNVHPRELAAYNNIPVETSLTLGQVIRIPAKTTMAPLPPLTGTKTEPEVKKEPTPKKAEPVVKKEEAPKKTEPVKKEEVVKETPAVKKEGSYPIYHKVAKKETLYHISKLYENVTIDDIKKWNKLSGDGVSEGTNLIVGYSKTKNAVAENKPVTEPIVKPEEVVKKKEEPKPVVKEPVESAKEAKEPERTVKTESVKEEPKNSTGKNFNGGVFKTQYSQQAASKKDIAEEKGTAGTFKSTSGWEDGKYYCLSNSVPSGTIVKVTNTANQKIVYAKVLDLIPDLKQNTGIILRLSNSAAQELGVSTDNFECTLNF